MTVGWIVHHHALGLSLEEYRWQATFNVVAHGGYQALWTTPVQTWRPLCGSLLVATDACGMDTLARYTLSALLLTVTAMLTGALARRIASWPAAVVTFAIALVAATHDEAYLWLGGRCDLLLGLFAMLAAHAALTAGRMSGRRAAIASVVTALACGLAAASKETGLLLPVAILPCVTLAGRSWRDAFARLLPAGLTSVALGCVRARVLGTALGPYVSTYVHRGPSVWIRNLLVGASRLVLGPAIHPATSMVVLVALAWAASGIAWLVARRRPSDLPMALSLAVLMAPVALMPADRALVPVVLAVAVVGGVTVVGRGGATAMILAAWLLTQAGSGLVMQSRWVRGYKMRSAYITAIRKEVVEGRPLVLVGGRQFFNGLYLEGPSLTELPGTTAVSDPCRVSGDFARASESLTSMPSAADPASFVLPHGQRCLPTVLRWPVTALVQQGDAITLTLATQAVVVWWGAGGTIRARALGNDSNGFSPLCRPIPNAMVEARPPRHYAPASSWVPSCL